MNILPDCDCLNFCGDDPRIDKGKATPCLGFREAQKEVQLRNAAPVLLEALQALLDDQRDASLPVLAKARAAIQQATGEPHHD